MYAENWSSAFAVQGQPSHWMPKPSSPSDCSPDTDIKTIIETCAEIATGNGFKVSEQHATTVALYVTEIAEILEHTTATGDPHVDDFIGRVCGAAATLKVYQKYGARGFYDLSEITNHGRYLEETADLVARIFAKVGADGHTDLFVDALLQKMMANKERPPLHGKYF